MILVTGGAGFIGSHLVDSLCADYSVKVIDDLSTGKIENLDRSIKKIEFHKMSILDENVKDVLRDVDVVFHLAAQADVRKSVEDPFFDLDVNVKGVLNIVENANDLERFIFASSGGAVYGEPGYLPVDEEHATYPVSPYGVSKLTGEKYLFYYQHNYGLKTTCLRFANVYGERQDPFGEAGVISIFINKMLKGERPEIFGDGEQTRDYIHVSDVVSANLLSLKKEGTFNIGTGVETSVNQLIEILSTLRNGMIKPIYTDERKGEVRRTSLSIARAKEGLGWGPNLTLKDGMKRTIDYFEMR